MLITAKMTSMMMGGPKNATSVKIHPLGQAILMHIQKHTVEKSGTNASSVTLHPLAQAI